MVQKYSEKAVYRKEQKKKETKTKTDADIGEVSGSGCRGACISKNEERLNEGPRLQLKQKDENKKQK